MSKTVRVMALMGTDAEVQAAAEALWRSGGWVRVDMRACVRAAAGAAYGLPDAVVWAVGALESVPCRTIEAAIGRDVVYQQFAKSLELVGLCGSEAVAVTGVRVGDCDYLAQLGVKLVEAAEVFEAVA